MNHFTIAKTWKNYELIRRETLIADECDQYFNSLADQPLPKYEFNYFEQIGNQFSNLDSNKSINMPKRVIKKSAHVFCPVLAVNN